MAIQLLPAGSPHRIVDARAPNERSRRSAADRSLGTGSVLLERTRQAEEPPVSIPAFLEVTRTIKFGERDAMGELRTSRPDVARRLDAAFSEMPIVGEEFLGFRLVHELGTGAFGRVFLARQASLADRLVALKIAVDLNGEPQRLAQMQHTNIMPIYSEHRSGNLYAVCMPFYGSTTLADLCKALRAVQSLPKSGKHLVSTLFNRQSTVRGNGDHSVAGSRSAVSLGSDSGVHPAPPPIPALAIVPANLTKIEEMSYADAVLWIAGRLASGLSHAHERGIIHRDLKPANVLLCDDGQPMLLDFNLAEDVKQRTNLAAAQVGGTLPYMSPEQLVAYRDNTGQVDVRCDIYALGLILFQLLTGQHAFPVRKGRSRTILPLMIADRAGQPPRLRALNRSISPAVESIVRHCLERDPDRRYASAAHIVADIDRHRANLPLKYAMEPSVVERAVKWARRHPRLASPTSLSALLAAIMLVVVSVRVQISRDAKFQEMERRHVSALATFRDFEEEYRIALDLLTTDDPSQLREGLNRGENALRVYEVFNRADWLEQASVKELSPAEVGRLKAQVGELAFLMARTAYFQPEIDDSKRQMNRIAENNLEGTALLAMAQQRDNLSGESDDDAERERIKKLLAEAKGVKDRGPFLSACEHAAQGRHREALKLLDAIVAGEPNDFGAWIQKARSHDSLEEPKEALAAYCTAIALRPDYARAFLERAIIQFESLGDFGQAKADLDRALTLTPDLLEARLHRARVLYYAEAAEDALKDIDWVLKQKGAPTRAWFIRARIREHLNDRDGAAADLEKGKRIDPTDAIGFVIRGVSFLSDNPTAALADFIQAEKLNPRCREATFNQCFLYTEKLKKPEKAMESIERLLKHHPDFYRAVSFKALLLARQGKAAQAVAEGRKSLRMCDNSANRYSIGCVMSLASAKNPAYRDESFQLLAQALKGGYGYDTLETDADLNPLSTTFEFNQLLGATRAIRVWGGQPVKRVEK